MEKESRAALGWLVVIILFGAYQLNGDFLPTSDAVASTYLPLSLIDDGNLTFTPEKDPVLFDWVLGDDAKPVVVHGMNQIIAGQPARDLYASGALRLGKIPYYLTPTTQEGVYANTFSFGSGLTALPVFVVARLIWGDTLTTRSEVVWYAGKLVASLAVALSGLFIFLAATRFVSRRTATGIALVYGLGTCAWSLASQALWQHGPNMLFLAAGTWLFLEAHRSGKGSAGAGLCYGWAVACRPTSFLVVAVTGTYLCFRHRDRCLPFLIGAGAVGVGVAYYNFSMFGSPLSFGQTEVSVAMAQSLTGSPSLFGTPIWKGAAGLLLSPSRGLLIYSPIAVLALWGVVEVWRNPRYMPLRPLSVAVGLIWIVAFTWYDWWGGWSFGYRPLVDTMVFLSLLAVPVVDRAFSSPWLRLPLTLLVAWSILVQVTGAFLYNGFGWNARTAFTVSLPGQAEPVVTRDHDEAVSLVEKQGGKLVGVEKLDVCRRPYLGRLWSWPDSQLRYYFTYPLLSRADKKEFIRYWENRYRAGAG